MKRAFSVIQTPIAIKAPVLKSKDRENLGLRRLIASSTNHISNDAASNQSITTMLVAVVPPYIHGATMRAAKKKYRAVPRTTSAVTRQRSAIRNDSDFLIMP